MTGQVLVEKQPLRLRSRAVPRPPPLLLQCRLPSNEQPPRALELRLQQQHLHLHNTHHVRAVAVPRARLNPTANLRRRKFSPLLLGRNFTFGSTLFPFLFFPFPSLCFFALSTLVCCRRIPVRTCWLVVVVNCAISSTIIQY